MGRLSMEDRAIVLSPSGATRVEAAASWIESRLAGGPVLLVCRQLDAADHLARTIAARRGALLGLTRLTLDALAYRLALPSLAAEGLAPQSPLVREALAARVVHECGEAGRLDRYAAVAHWPGFARALAATIDELRLFGIDAAALARRLPEEKALAELLARYEAAERTERVADRAAVLARAVAAVEDGDAASPFVGVATVFLDVPVATPAESRFVAALARRAPRVLATVPEADAPSRRAFEEALGVRPVAPAISSSVPGAVRDLQSFLFRERSPEPRGETPDVVVLTAPGEAQEAVELARLIHVEAEAGTPFDRIAIFLKVPEVYTPLVEDALARASIPAFFANGTKRPDPAGRAFLALLDCKAEQLSASRFAEYLSLGQVPALTEDGAPPPVDEERLWTPPRHELAPTPVDAAEPVQLDLFAEPPPRIPEPDALPALEGTLRTPRRWERLLVDAAVIGGRDRWERRLRGLGRELEARLAELDDPEGAEALALRRQREELAHLERFALPLVGRLDALPASARWGAWIDALEILAHEALARPEGVVAMLEELRPMASVGPVELFEVREVLSERLTELAQEPPRYRYGRVFVAPIDAARGASFDVVLVPGLAERSFPPKIVEDPLLLDAARRRLDAGLPLQADRVLDERLALHLAAGAAARRVVFSYPSLDVQKGRPRVPSFYLLEVARASRGELPDFETLEKRAVAASGARLGWPAPRDPARAIDAAEHDLAFLSRVLAADARPEELRGAGRYLMTVNPALERSLRVRYRKYKRRFSNADGMTEVGAAGRAVLAQHRLEARPYSVTALEKYAGCPYRFFLNAIVRLRPRETAEAVTHLDALTRGRILHEAQYRISIELEREGLLPVRRDNLARVLEVGDRVFESVEADFAEELAPAIDRIWRDELRSIRADVRGWLRHEAEATGDWVPYRREFTFGMRPKGPADPASVTEHAVLRNGLRLRGAIDLVERRRGDEFRVTDHKSGKAWVPPGAVVNGGETLQPILYALAYEALTGEHVVEARLYYCTERGGYEERVIEPDDEAIAIVDELRRRLDDVIAKGFFPPAPKAPLGCSYCDYQPVCGPLAEIRADRKKDDPRLSPLNWLRSLT